MKQLSLLMAQFNPKVGDISANTEKLIEIIEDHQDEKDLIIFPELAISGYPPEDLLLRNDFYQWIEQAITDIAAKVNDCHVIIGHPQLTNGMRYNAATLFFQGKRLSTYHKQYLPNYRVFDEKRYFVTGEDKPCVFEINGYKLGLCICEDLWAREPVNQIKKAGADTVICINASPYTYKKQQQREDVVKEHIQNGLNLIYVNQVGGQDELVFDGQSFVMDADENLRSRAPAFIESLHEVTFKNNKIHSEITPLMSKTEAVFQALVCGTRDYVFKNNFEGVLLGLSGGIDSAVTLAVAVEALGAERVHAVLMPSRFTADMSLEDALKQLHTLKVGHSNLSIEPAFNAILQTLAPEFQGLAQDETEENIQARLRAVLLMALSNKTGKMVLTTSNKSETAVGYSTLYGDMAGGYGVLKDVYKTLVYDLAKFINKDKKIIPERVITRPPSAELSANQTDQDSLPDYPILDDILEGFIEHDLSEAELVQKGHSPELVRRVVKMIIRNEYKRQQAAPGARITPRAFGKDWRYPITSGAFSN